MLLLYVYCSNTELMGDQTEGQNTNLVSASPQAHVLLSYITSRVTYLSSKLFYTATPPLSENVAVSIRSLLIYITGKIQ